MLPLLKMLQTLPQRNRPWHALPERGSVLLLSRTTGITDINEKRPRLYETMGPYYSSLLLAVAAFNRASSQKKSLAHYAFLGAGAGAFFGGAGASSTFLGAGLAGAPSQLLQGEAVQHLGAGAQHFGAGAQQVGAGAQHAGAGLQQLVRTGLQQLVRTGLQQRTRLGLQQRTRIGLQQRTRSGLQQRSRTGLQQVVFAGLQQRLRKPNASASDTLKDATSRVIAAIKESVTVFRIMVYSSDSQESGSTSPEDKSLPSPSNDVPESTHLGKTGLFFWFGKFYRLR
ncbi:hypothetical protein [Gimesia panareensis]|uniref:hypothetical protein n=1 Tax=Gimesia panareensis TaxID=2527978 RepID=UPI0018D7FFCD|nr:hypothetical protein [Gimesia panareensis]